jgi:4-amino-4-deoxy-L-arabinose transferase-like glycosyltransferase
MIRTNQDHKKEMAIIFLTALIVRLFALAGKGSNLYGLLSPDAHLYNRIASNLLEQGNFIFDGHLAIVTPLYPLFLAGSSLLPFTDRLAALLIQAFLGGVTALLIYLIASDLFTRRAAIVSGLLTAIYWPLVCVSVRLLSEALFIPLLAATVLLLVRALKNNSVKYFSLAGFLCGLACLTRPFLFFFPFLMIIGVCAYRKCNLEKTELRNLLIFFAIHICVMMPWALRNQVVLGAPIFTSTNSGMVLASSVMPREGTIYGFNIKPADLPQNKRYILDLPELERDSELKRFAVGYLMQHPEKIPRQLILKVLYFVSPFDWEILGHSDGVFNAWFVLTLFLAVWGMVAGRTNTSRLVILLLLGYSFAMSMMTYASPRLRLPAELALILYAGVGWVRLENVTSPRPRYLITGAALLLAATASFYSPQVKVFCRELLVWMGIW